MLPNHNDTTTITLQDLPMDILHEIFSSFFPEDFANILSVNHALSERLKDNKYWQDRYRRHFTYAYQLIDINYISDWHQKFVSFYKGQHPDRKSRELFFLAKENNTEELIKILKFSDMAIKDGFGTSLAVWISFTKNQSLLDHCYQLGNKSYTEFLRTTPSFDINFNLLRLACKTNQTDTIHALMHKDAPPAHLYTLLNDAVEHGHIDSVNALLTYNIELNLTKYSPLHIAAWKGNPEITAALLKKGAHINGDFLDQPTPLCIATFIGHREVVKILLEEGADIHRGTLGGLFNPIRAAKYFGFNELALDIAKQMLRNYITEINKRDDDSYKTYEILGVEFNFSIFNPCPAKQKKDAANALWRVCFEGSNESLVPHEKALNQGELKPIYEDIKSLTEAIHAKERNGLVPFLSRMLF